MFGMSFAEIGVILVLALVLLGPEKLPEVARTAGKALREVRKASNLLRDAIMLEDTPYSVKPPGQNPSVSNGSAAAGLAGAAAASHQMPPRYDLDHYDGPLDQLPDEDFALAGTMTHDPYKNMPSRAEVPLHPQEVAPLQDSAQEVILTSRQVEAPTTGGTQIPGLEAWTSSGSDAQQKPEQVEVFLHEQLQPF